MSQEEVILVNDKDEILGYLEKMKAHQKGLLHRAISVFIFNSNNEWLLQQRATHKYHSRDLWSNSACTHPIKNETVVEAANRRLKQEMGMTVTLEKKFQFQYKVHLDNDLIENELDHIFIGYSDELPKVNPEEVSNYRYVKTKALQKEISLHPENFSEWFKLLFDKIEKLVF